MKRPMILLAVAWLSGLLLGQHGLNMLVVFICSYFLFILFFLIILRRYPAVLFPYVRKEKYGAMTVFLLCIPVLFCGGFLRQQMYVRGVAEDLSIWQQLEAESETQIFVIGTVTGKTVEEERVILVLSDCVVDVDGDCRTAGDCQVTVEEEGSKRMAESFVGNRVRVYGKFFLYEEAGNPGQFDAASYYQGKGLFASVKALRVEVLSEDVSVIGQAMFWLKQRMREVLTTLYPVEQAGVLAAMLLGDKDLLPEEIEDLYQQNGISHILAISGLHISMLCMGLFRILRRVGIPLTVASAVAVCFLGFYVVFTGAGTSSLRAGIMCLVLLAAKLLRRSYDLLSSLSLAAILVTLVRPQEITSAGFLLSFGAVLGVAAAQEIGKGNALLFGGMIQLVTLPISLWFYYELSPYSILLNLIIIPLATFVLGGGLFSVLVGLFVPEAAKLLAGGTYLILSFYEWIGGATQKLPYSFVLIGRPEGWQIIVYYAVLAGVVLRKKRSFFPAVGILACLFILFLPKAPSFTISFLDVSQGDGILLQTEEGEVLLFDGGSTDVSAVGEYRIGPFLKQQGIALIDTVSVSHMDSDHYSGVLELLEAMPVYGGRAAYLRAYKGTVGICELVLPEVKESSEEYLELVALCAEKNVAIRYLSAGEELYSEEELLIECLAPVQAIRSENDTSLVFLLQTSELVLWLMGDAGVEAEEEMVSRLGGQNSLVREALAEKLCILKVGHHGSKTSTGEAFLSYVQPDIAVISCGYKNSYGHPHADVVGRLLEYGSEIYRTDLQGCVTIRIKKDGKLMVDVWQE